MHHTQTDIQIVSLLKEVKSYVTALSKNQLYTSMMPKALGYVWESEPNNTILLHDAVGPPVFLPMMLLRSKDSFDEILRVMYTGIRGQHKILRKEYTITDEETDNEINESNWSDIVRSGKELSLNIILNADSTVDFQHCPRCSAQTPRHNISQLRRRCHMCRFTFWVLDRERVLDTDNLSDELDNPATVDGTSQSNMNPTANQPNSDRRVELMRKERKYREQVDGDNLIFRRVHFYRDKWIEKPLTSTVIGRNTDRIYNINDLPPLHRAAATGNLTEINRLLQDVDQHHVNSKLTSKMRADLPGYWMYFEGCTPLHLASWHGQLQALRCLLENGADIHAKSAFGEQSLWFAVSGLYPDKVFHPLIALGADIFATNDTASNGTYNVLEEACLAGRAGIASYLLTKKVDLISGAPRGNELLSLSLRAGSLPTLEILLDNGMSLGMCDSPLHLAAYAGHLETIKRILEDDISRLRHENRDGQTPLHLACRGSHFAVVDFLISVGSDPGVAEDNDAGYLPLHISCFENDISSVKRLVEAGESRLSQKNLIGNTPLHLACKFGHNTIVTYLVEKGASLSTENQYGETPFFLACSGGNPTMVEYLLNRTIFDPTEQNIYGLTVLNIAVEPGKSIAIVKLLLDKGADVMLLTDIGNAPLHRAILTGQIEISKELLDGSPSTIEIKTSGGYTPLACACFSSELSLVANLLEYGANIHSRNEHEETPLLIAVSTDKSNAEIIELLLSKGANPNDCDNEGASVLHMAARFQSVGTIELLMAKGTDTKTRDKDDWNVVRFAAMRGTEEVAEVIDALLDMGAEITEEDRAWWLTKEDEWKNVTEEMERIRVTRPYFATPTAEQLEDPLRPGVI